MRLLQTVVKRLWDAVLAFVGVLSGRLTQKPLTPLARVKHNALLQGELLEVASLLEKMHAWTSRMAARDSREAKKLLEEGGDVPPVGEDPAQALRTTGATGAPLSPADRKKMLRRYVTSQRYGFDAPAPPPVAPAESDIDLLDIPARDGDGMEDEP